MFRKVIIFVATISSVIAFQPQSMPGVSKPLGFFDPLGFSTNKNEIEFKKIQESEIKHGRIAMLASIGLLLQQSFHPLLNNQIIGDSIYHYQIFSSKYPLFTPLLIGTIALIEGKNILKGWELNGPDKISNLREDYFPGDLGLKLFQYSDEELIDLRTKELNNGRLAMIATLLIIIQQYIETTN